MDAMYIHIKPHVPSSEDRTRDDKQAFSEQASRQRPVSNSDFSSGSVATTSKGPRPSSSSPSSPPPSLKTPVSPALPLSFSLQSSTAVSGTLKLGDRDHDDNGAAAAAATTPTFSATASSSASFTLSQAHPAPLFFSPGINATPTTSLVGAKGSSIPLDDSSTAHRTSALRELNSSFPSPVFRHRHTKSAGAQNTTYSQPVIVRTYSGTSAASPSRSTYCRPSSSSSSRRTNSRFNESYQVPLPPPSPQFSSYCQNDPAVHGGKDAQSRSWGLTSSLLGMARSKVKKASFLPWSWSGSLASQSQPDEPKLPPLEAFSYKGFMADLQATTDIQADLDRIAEICARSRYSLSNQYDSHMAPHGSGTGFVMGSTQQPGRSKGRSHRKGSSSPGGPTLQAVPSDDDEGSARGYRPRRGGMGSGRRRSTAYGTLETIMSSSRSSEEDKTKRKSAAEIAEAVRDRASRKAQKAAKSAATRDTTGVMTGNTIDDTTGDTTGDATGVKPDQTPSSGYGKAPRNNRDHIGQEANALEEETDAGFVECDNALPDTDGPSSATIEARQQRHAKSDQRHKSTSFAHAMMERNRKRQDSRASVSKNDLLSGTHTSAASFAAPALLGEPTFPCTIDGILDIYSVSDSTDSLEDPTPATGFFTGLAYLIPRTPGSNHNGHGYDGSHGQPLRREVTAVRAAPSGPSHAEGSLRGLLKPVEPRKHDKGKAVDNSDIT